MQIEEQVLRSIEEDAPASFQNVLERFSDISIFQSEEKPGTLYVIFRTQGLRYDEDLQDQVSHFDIKVNGLFPELNFDCLIVPNNIEPDSFAEHVAGSKVSLLRKLVYNHN